MRITPNVWTPERIRRLRAQRHWTQAKLAKRLRVALVTVQSWEQGVYSPRQTSAINLEALERKVKE